MTVTQERLRFLLEYDPATGVFKWRNSRGIKIKAGDIAGSISSCNGKPYRNIGIDGIKYYAHRLAWLYQTGVMPEQVDHEDHDGLNNKWLNLKESDYSGNHKNLSRSSLNTTGISGVHYVKLRGNYQAYISCSGKRINLGTFSTLAEAASARKSAEVRLGFHPNHGKP